MALQGTPLQYVFNSETPIIRPDGYLYALNAGVWFTTALIDTPWSIATSVPAVIYTIPPSSALYYVTFVHVYGFTPEVVYVGYTPGYLGTVVDRTAWSSTVPATTTPLGRHGVLRSAGTYGVQAQPVYNPGVDMAYGMALGLTTAALVDSWEAVYYDSYYHGYPCCGSTSANVYGHWGDTSVPAPTPGTASLRRRRREIERQLHQLPHRHHRHLFRQPLCNPYDGTAGRG